MGEQFSKVFGGGEDDKRILLKQATRARQEAAQREARDKFVQEYMGIFGQPYGNTNFQESLSGYFNNQPLQDIAQNLAANNTFRVRTKPIYKTIPGEKAGLLDYLSIGPGSGSSVAMLASNGGKVDMF